MNGPFELMQTSVYKKILGTEFEKLSTILQLSHGNVSHVKATGVIDVEYGKNIFVGILNKLSKMPPKGNNQKIKLRIERTEEKEIWERYFTKQTFSTDQFAKNGSLHERSGLMTLTFKMFVKEGGLYVVQESTLFAGIPLPKFMGVHATATSVEEGNGWRISVEVRSPVLGLMLRYSGLVKLEE